VRLCRGRRTRGRARGDRGSLEEPSRGAADGRSRPILDRWKRLSPSSAGRQVTVVPMSADDAPADPLRGVTRGLAADGSLRVEDAAGVVHVVRFGGTVRFEAAERRERGCC
jgi:hypothetical protein